MKLNIKCSTGTSFSVEVEESDTIAHFKTVCAEKSNIPAEQQRLIFGGHVLKDERTIESYGIFSALLSLLHILT